MKVLGIFEATGDFAEDKDAAALLRTVEIAPAIRVGQGVILEFTGIRIATQSFIHALISDVIRSYGEEALDLLEFKGCSLEVRGIVETVVQYSLDSANLETA